MFSSRFVAIVLSAALVTHAAQPVAPPGAVAVTNSPGLARSFASWKAACDKLPSNRSLRGRLAGNELLPLPRFSEFDEVLTALEQVAEFSLNPGMPVRALSRTVRAKAQTGI